jgi:hypothetical protein
MPHKPARPLFVIRLSAAGYYAVARPWQAVPADQADRLTHQEARRICGQLRQPRLGYHAEVEPAGRQGDDLVTQGPPPALPPVQIPDTPDTETPAPEVSTEDAWSQP